MLCTFWLANVLIHNGVQLFISHLTTWLRTHRFSAPTFRPSRATNHWKNAVFSDFPTFSRAWTFFLLTLSLFDLISSSLLFSDSSHLCFSSVHIVGSLTSKLSSISSIFHGSRLQANSMISSLSMLRVNHFWPQRDAAWKRRQHSWQSNVCLYAKKTYMSHSLYACRASELIRMTRLTICWMVDCHYDTRWNESFGSRNMRTCNA